jgi:NAD(P)-dependent dehydrogenase (short-subunit alcohol dehydrogenase family)
MAGIQDGKVAIVTGGSANLGKLFAESLADDGANIVVAYNGAHRADEAAQVVSDLEGRGVRDLRIDRERVVVLLLGRLGRISSCGRLLPRWRTMGALLTSSLRRWR